MMRQSFVLYADILGTTESWTNSDPASLERQLRFIEFYKSKLIELAKSLQPGFGTINSVIVTFSDNMAIALPIEDEALQELLMHFHEGETFPNQDRNLRIENMAHEGLTNFVFALIDLMRFQFEFVLAGHFLRGATTFGAAFAEEGLVAGPALVAAVQEEEMGADMPIIVAPGWMTELYKIDTMSYIDDMPLDSVFNSLFVHTEFLDKEGDRKTKLFLNYLGWVSDVASYEREDGAVLLEKHRNLVTERLTQTKPNIRRKYLWVAQYHNWYCDRNGYKLQVDPSVIDDFIVSASFRTLAETV